MIEACVCSGLLHDNKTIKKMNFEEKCILKETSSLIILGTENSIKILLKFY